MKAAIDKIVKVKNDFTVNANQALFLLAVMEDIYTVDLPSADMLDLIKREFMKGNRITPETMVRINESTTVTTATKVTKAINATYPKLVPDTANIVKRLAVPFIGERLNSKEWEKCSAYCPNNPLMVPFLFMFMQMFPSSVAEKNRAWNKQFNTEYEGVTLRRLTPGTVNKFKQIWKTKDIGLFLLGTYMSIQQSCNSEGKYFVQKLENYLREYQTWYDEAKDLLDAGKLENLTAAPARKSSNTTVI